MSTSIRWDRWVFKKAGRSAVGAVGMLAGSGHHDGPRVRVLTYHRFGKLPRDPYCVAPRDFDAHMRLLAERQLAISLADLLAFLEGRQELRDGSVLVTTDDGFRSVLIEMLPILRRHKVPAVAFITAGLIGTGWPNGAPEPYLTWDEVRTLSNHGMAIGSHALSHRSLAQLDDGEARHEATDSRRAIEEAIDARVEAFAYPYGTRADFDMRSADILRAAGYRLGFTSQHGAIARGERDWLLLPRIKVEAGDPVRMFSNLCRGALDAWGYLDALALPGRRKRAQMHGA